MAGMDEEMVVAAADLAADGVSYLYANDFLYINCVQK